MISILAFLSHIDGHDWYCLSKSPAIELRRSDEDALFFRRAVSITPVSRSLTIENFVSMFIERERKRLFDGSITGGKVENFADAAVVQINDSIWGHIWFLIALAIVIYEIYGQVADKEVD